MGLLSEWLWERGRGFSLRNDVAHERLLLKDIDVKIFLKEIHRVNILNQLMSKVFYLDFLGVHFTSKNLDYSKKMFGCKK